MSDVRASPVELIEAKREGRELGPQQITDLIHDYTAGAIPDYQMSAMLMAVFFRGMTDDELAVWTAAMLDSGDRIDLSDHPLPKVDKHSTGGVGDKVSIPLAPLVAACGVAVPMMSGRGLGHTGGTLDKLESIPGFTTRLDPDRFLALVHQHDLVLAGQSETLVPADRKLYALRDATGTVPSIPLISSSIMSKKLAEGLDALVLDVKTGSGAFMKDAGDARELAETMIGIGAAHGVRTIALLTTMDQPLGLAVGNANEIAESIAVLQGGGPDDLVELVLRLGEEMLLAGGVVDTNAAARDRLQEALASGAALDRFRQIVASQNGDPSVIDNPALLPAAEHHHVLEAPTSGFVTGCDALSIGVGAMRLGAGRKTTDDVIDHAVGVDLVAKIGAEVQTGDPLCTVRYNDPSRLEPALQMLKPAWTIEPAPVEPRPLILDTIT